ncbi:thaumatin family protein [Streptomyces sp. NPDC020490]|uniref:thaumatin family protein n=1 Tax=Streptomyces sp. NPDC020490 TaxID=3365078 RepID=UPI0037A9B8F2
MRFPRRRTLLFAFLLVVLAASALVPAFHSARGAPGAQEPDVLAAASGEHTVTLRNDTGGRIWVGSTVNADGSSALTGLPVLDPGQSATITVPERSGAGHWRGTFFARQGCTGEDGSTFHCAVGDCGPFADHCSTGEQPTSLAEFNFDPADSLAPWYDVSHVNAVSVPITITPDGVTPPGSGECAVAGCAGDLLAACPPEDLTRDPATGRALVCVNPNRDAKTSYSDAVTRQCPKAYAWSKQDAEPGNQVVYQCTTRRAPGPTAGTAPGPTPGPAPPRSALPHPVPPASLKRDVGQSDDAYEPPGLLRRPLVIGAVGLAVALAVVVPLIALGSGSGGGSGGDDAQGKAADSAQNVSRSPVPLPTAVTTTPTTTVSPSISGSSSPGGSPTPTKKPAEPSAGSSRGATAAPGTTAGPYGTEPTAPHATKPAAPRKQTAADAASKPAASTPGRHICYRVYLAKDGWQKPVCDGLTAGRVNGRQKIKSINIATAGTKGTAANAYVHREHWKTPWSGVVDGVDNYIGSVKPGYPYMIGFIINVGDGAVCQNAAVSGHGWLGLGCDEPKGQAPGNYIFGGTLDDSLYLQAVRFTV